MFLFVQPTLHQCSLLFRCFLAFLSNCYRILNSVEMKGTLLELPLFISGCGRGGGGGGGCVSEIVPKKGGSDFFHKKEEVGKIGGSFLKKRSIN